MSRRSVIHPAQFHIQEEFAMFAPAADVTTGVVGARTGESRLRSLFAWGARCFGICIVLLLLRISPAAAQISGSIGGTVSDESSAAVSGAQVIARNTETTAERDATTDSTGHYQFSSLPLGPYELRATKQGFATEVRTGIRVVVNEEGAVNLTLKIGSVSQQITVEGDAPLVSVTTQDISGLVGEQQVKDLPLNGRSYDLLLPLNPGIVNFTSQKAGGTGVSNSTTANNFAVSGNRPQQNLFLLNGVEFTGAAENNMTPGGASGELLGVDAVREFNVLRDSYGAEYGKKPGGQVIIVTQSGANQLHGSLYEFVRNNALDAPNFFDEGSAPPFVRNQFGAAIGGPVRKNKTFFFANYEGLRQSLNQTSLAFVPSLAARSLAVPSVVPLLNLWPTPPASAPDFSGISPVSSSPLQTIREDFGTARVDQIFSQRDSLAAIYTIDDGGDVTATIADPYSSDILNLREQVLSLDETHVFSAGLTTPPGWDIRAPAIFSRASPRRNSRGRCSGIPVGAPVGAVVIGGSAASNRGAGRTGGEQQRERSAHCAKSLHVRRRHNVNRGRHHSVSAVVRAVSVERDDRAEPIRSGHVCELDDIPGRDDIEFSVRSGANGIELAIVFCSVVRARCDSSEAESNRVPGHTRRIIHRME